MAVITITEPVITGSGGGSGTGDVVGPASATNGAIASFNGTTGKIIQDNEHVLVNGGAAPYIEINDGAGNITSFGTDGGAYVYLEDANGVLNIGTTTAEIKKAVVTISSAELLALPETPVEVIAAPGAGKAIEIVNASAYYVYGGVAYVSHMTGTGIQIMLYCPQNDSTYPPSMAYARWWNGESADAFINYAFPATRLVLAQTTQEGVISERFDNKPIYFNTYGYGQIATLSVGAGGAGYAVNDTFTIDSYAGTVGVVDSVSGGAVTAAHLTTNAINASAQNGLATTALTGVGTGLTINALTIQSLSGGNGTIQLTINYVVVDL